MTELKKARQLGTVPNLLTSRSSSRAVHSVKHPAWRSRQAILSLYQHLGSCGQVHQQQTW